MYIEHVGLNRTNDSYYDYNLVALAVIQMANGTHETTI